MQNLIIKKFDDFKIHYDEPIIENVIKCLDMIRLSLILY